MKYVWPILLGVCRTVYFGYSLWCFLFPFAVLGIAYSLWTGRFPTPDAMRDVAGFVGMALTVLAIALVATVFVRKTRLDPNVWQSAFMSWFGTLRWFRNASPAPMVKIGLPSTYLVENPGSYRLGGKALRDILGRLQPGDILLRAYDGYIDGAFIKLSSQCSQRGYRRGWFTHAALYVGTLGAEDRAKVPTDFRNNEDYFAEGPQMVVHAMAKGVHTEDILTWCRCDYIAIFRVKPQLAWKRDVDAATKTGTRPRPSEALSSRLKLDIRNKVPVDRAEAIEVARMSALEEIGESYDFDCVVTDKYTRFTCAELVYYCYRGIHDALGLGASLHALYPLGMLSRHWAIMKRLTVTPDDFCGLGRSEDLDVVWIDPISSAKLGVTATV